MSYDYDLAVIGAGPGGYVAAIRASQLGMKTVICEKDKPGGVCLNIGCIPSKSLIQQASLYGHAEALEEMGLKVDRGAFDYSRVFKKSRIAADRLTKGVRFLLKKNGISVIEEEVKISDPHAVVTVSGSRVTAGNILIATGSRPKEIPNFSFDEERILSSTGALMAETLPEAVVILGAGAIGVEFAYVYSSFGVKVVLVEMLDQILPLEDEETAAVLARVFGKRGIDIRVGTRAASVKRKGKGVEVLLEDKGGAGETVAADRILVAVGRTANTEDLGLEDVGIKLEGGFIPTGEYYQTETAGIYAAGDVIGPPLLAHSASKEGEVAVEHMAGKSPPPRIDPLSVPGAVYSEPQIASFGYTEAAAKERGVSYRASSFPYRGAGKAVAVNETEGLVKILTDPETEEIIGVHIAGSDATELIHELLLARSSELLPADVAGMIHAHPTLSEAVMEAARAVDGWAIHM